MLEQTFEAKGFYVLGLSMKSTMLEAIKTARLLGVPLELLISAVAREPE